ncbi:MAG: hypothetical protein ACR2N3_17015 [Pyrinomonadaceae bacterium]
MKLLTNIANDKNNLLMVSVSLVIIFIFALSASAQQSKNIREVDFKNFTYSLSCGNFDSPEPVTVKNGEYQGPKREEQVHLVISEIKFADLNGDGKEEAIIQYKCESGKNYEYAAGMIFTIKNNKSIFLTNINGGDKSNGYLTEIRVVKNLLLVKTLQTGYSKDNSAPESVKYIKTAKFRLQGKRLIQVGKANWRENNE